MRSALRQRDSRGAPDAARRAGYDGHLAVKNMCPTGDLLSHVRILSLLPICRKSTECRRGDCGRTRS
jgi:hypothetical protein